MSRSKLCSVFQRRSWTLLMTLITTGLEWSILYFTNCKADLHTEGLPEYGVLSLQLNATMSRTGSNFLQRNTKLCILSYLKQRLLLNILHSQFANFFLIVSNLQHRFVSGTVSGTVSVPHPPPPPPPPPPGHSPYDLSDLCGRTAVKPDWFVLSCW